MTNDEAQTKAQEWYGQAGGRLVPQLTENELAGLVNELSLTQAPVVQHVPADDTEGGAL